MIKHNLHTRNVLIVMIILAIGSCLSFVAEAKTLVVDVTDDKFTPSKIHVELGDRVLFKNKSRIVHSVHLVGRVYRFGMKHYIHDELIFPDSRRILHITDDMPAGTYNFGCSLHNRMRGTLIVSAPKELPEAVHEGERRK